MLEPWNDSSILPPPVNMFLCVKKVDVSALKHVCNNMMKVLSKQSPLHKESALCSRFLYKYDRKFRNDIGYRNFRKVHTALKKYLSLNLMKDIENFLLALPSENDDEKYLPTRQMLEYVMLRIITFSMIMLRVCVCSKQAAIFYLNRIRRGESHWMSLLPYGLLSRLWSMTMVLVQHSSTWYSNLYPYLSKLEPKGLHFLPVNYKLPGNLEEWLDLKNVDCFGRFDWDQSKITEIDRSVLDDEQNDLFDDILSFANHSNQNEAEDELEAELKPMLSKCNEEIKVTTSLIKTDHGEVLSRDTFKMAQGGEISRQSINIDQGEKLSRESYKNNQGEALSRESFKVLLNSQIKMTKCNNSHSQYANKIVKEKKVVPDEQIKTKNRIKDNLNEHSHTKVTSAVSLKAFLDKEEALRNESDNSSLTNHLSLMQWHALKNTLLKLCDGLTNRKIERKFQKIWKQKCLDYK